MGGARKAWLEFSPTPGVSLANRLVLTESEPAGTSSFLDIKRPYLWSK